MSWLSAEEGRDAPARRLSHNDAGRDGEAGEWTESCFRLHDLTASKSV